MAGYCGLCALYHKGVCEYTRKVTGYLMKKDCFEAVEEGVILSGEERRRIIERKINETI